MKRRWSQRYFGFEQTVPVLRNGIVAHYLAGGSGARIFDYSGYQNISAFAGDTAWTLGREHLRQGLAFDGTGDYSDAATSAYLDVTNTTLSAWVYPLDNTNNQILIGKPSVAGSHTDPYFSYSLQIVGGGGGAFRMWVATGGAGTNASAASAAGTVTVGTWQHITGTYDGVNVKIFLNGVLQATTAKTGNLAAVSSPLRLGANGAAGELFTGTLSDIRTYNRGLSEPEVFMLASPSLQVIRPTSNRVALLGNPRNGDFLFSGF